MSAYLCDPNHLSAVADILKIYVDQNIDPAKMFKALLRENLKSLNARYRLGKVSDHTGTPKVWVYTKQLDTTQASGFTMAVRCQHLKALACYDYQACEHGAAYYKGRIGKLIAQAKGNVALATAFSLIAYDDAKWGWPR